MSSAVSHDQAVQAFRSVLHLAQQLRYLFDRQLADDGLTTAQATLLTFVHQQDQPLSYTELARLMATSHQNVAQIIRALQGHGFVEVHPAPGDGRVRQVHVTPASRRYWAARDEADVAYLASLFDTLAEDELRDLNGLLVRLRPGVQQHYDAVRNPTP